MGKKYIIEVAEKKPAGCLEVVLMIVGAIALLSYLGGNANHHGTNSTQDSTISVRV